jgi:DNA-binding transcriptional LysR family regulator
MKSYDLNLLVALDALLATGSVTAAAQRMHLSTPAMSHTLARIRDTLGDPILVRAGRKLVPTPRALALAEPVSRLLADARALVAPPGTSLEAVERKFVIRAPDGIAVIYGATLSLALQQVMPLARLHFLPEGHVDLTGLREGRIDLDVGAFREREPEIEVTLLSQQRLVGVVKAGHPLLKGKLTAKRFAAERHVAVAARPREGQAVDAALEQAGLTRFVAVTVPSGFAAVMVASRSALVACVPEPVAHGMAPKLGMAVFELPLPVAAEPFVIAWHPRHSADLAHRWLREQLPQVLAAGKTVSRSLRGQLARMQASGKTVPRRKSRGAAV